MGLHVIVGAGSVGGGTAQRLVEAGHTVKLVSRSGSGPRTEGIELVSADATDTATLTRLATGADAIYNCANPPYHRWSTDWPPLAGALLAAAEATGAGLVTMGNLYGYGSTDHPMTERDPLAATTRKGRVRARMWHDALAAHRAGRVRATEARASDYFGPPILETGPFGSRLMPRLLGGAATPGGVVSQGLPGRTFRHFGALDAPHTWSYVPDVTAALATLGTDDRAWGRPWHVPSGPPLTVREMVTETARAAGVPVPRMASLPRFAMLALGMAVPLVRELEEIRYQHDEEFVMDSSDFTTTFGMTPTPLDEALRTTVDWWRHRLAA
ncbi:MAG: NAD-dependent epimerase/dehydratase family protein [Micromonosporaceae bacterium]